MYAHAQCMYSRIFLGFFCHKMPQLYPPLLKLILVGLCSVSIELVLRPEEEMYMTCLSLKNVLLKHAFT